MTSLFRVQIPQAVQAQFVGLEEAARVEEFLKDHKEDLKYQRAMRQQQAQYRAGSQPLPENSQNIIKARTDFEKANWVKTALYPANIFGIGNWAFTSVPPEYQQKTWTFDATPLGLAQATSWQATVRLKKLERLNPRIKKGLEMAAQAIGNGFYSLIVVGASENAEQVIEKRIKEIANQTFGLQLAQERREPALPEDVQNVLEGFMALEYEEQPDIERTENRDRISAHQTERDDDWEDTSGRKQMVSIRDRATGRELGKTFAFLPAVPDVSPQGLARLGFYIARQILKISGVGLMGYFACLCMATAIQAIELDYDPLPSLGKSITWVKAPSNLIDYKLGLGQRRTLQTTKGVYIAIGTQKGNKWLHCHGTVREALLTLQKVRSRV
jgi:hypothetical protein